MRRGNGCAVNKNNKNENQPSPCFMRSEGFVFIPKERKKKNDDE